MNLYELKESLLNEIKDPGYKNSIGKIKEAFNRIVEGEIAVNQFIGQKEMELRNLKFTDMEIENDG